MSRSEKTTQYKEYNNANFNHKRISTIVTLLLLISINAFSQTQEEITKAISEGNCVFLYNFIQEPEGKDARLLASARNALERYTKRDTAVSRFRTNRMETRIRNVGTELTENVFLDPQTYLPRVVERLMSGITDSFLKAKTINDWICNNIAYDTEHYYGREYSGQDYISVIENKKGVCSGFTNLFNEMCRLANVESIGINGFSKGAGYDGRMRDYPDHDWNAVRINNKWYLIDVTWNAGHLDGYSYIKRYSTDYLFLDPRAFLYTHLPANNKYQFYAPLVTKEQFFTEPKIPGIFFRYGLEFKGEIPAYNNIVDDIFSFELVRSNSGVTLSSQLRTRGHQNIPNGVRQSSAGSTFTFTYNIPDNQTYMAHVFARFSNERRLWDRIPITRYEQNIIPMLDSLLENKRITEKEKNHFLGAYYKIEYNGYYYLIDDQFDTDRNNALIKLHGMVNLSFNMAESILSFNVRKN